MQHAGRIKLSVCIPTFNRGDFIGDSLESIISQATDEVEIVIVDGGSKDNTAEVVRSYQSRFPRLQYVRNGSQIGGAQSDGSSAAGFDRDCNRAVELAHGEYCWLFTDDDIMKPGAIQAVLDAVNRSSFALLVVNAEVRNADLSELLNATRLRMGVNRIYRTTENELLFGDVGNHLSFVGGVVIKRQLWIVRDKRPYFGTGFIHLGVIFQSVLPEDTLVIAEPLVSIRYGNAMWTEKYFEFWMFKWPQLIWSFIEYSGTAKTKICYKEPWRHLRTLLLNRARGAYSMDEYRKWLQPRLESYWRKIASKVIACAPGRVVNLVAFVYFDIVGRNPTKQLVLTDLRNSRFYFGRGRQQPVRSEASDRPVAAGMSIQ